MEFNFKKALFEKNGDVFYVRNISELTLEEILEKYDDEKIYEHYVENLTITDGESDTGINIDCGRWSRSNKIFQINYDKPDFIVINEPTLYSDVDFSDVYPEYINKLNKNYNSDDYYNKYHNFTDKSGVFNIKTHSFPISLFKKDYVKTIVPNCFTAFGEIYCRKLILLMTQKSTNHEIKTYNYNVKIILKWS
jgi:hypothetical protein